MEPDKLMHGISKEILTTLTAMGKAKTPDEKLIYSETVKNLCDSLGVFLDLLSGMELYDDYYDDDDDEDESIPF